MDAKKFVCRYERSGAVEVSQAADSVLVKTYGKGSPMEVWLTAREARKMANRLNALADLAEELADA